LHAQAQDPAPAPKKKAKVIKAAETKKSTLLTFGRHQNVPKVRSNNMLEVCWLLRLESDESEHNLVPIRPFVAFREAVCVKNGEACRIMT
jgi:hypothetical protein